MANFVVDQIELLRLSVTNPTTAPMNYVGCISPWDGKRTVSTTTYRVTPLGHILCWFSSGSASYSGRNRKEIGAQPWLLGS